MNGRMWLMVGALVAGLAVGSGALGAHWFEDQVQKLYEDEGLRERRMHNWETASQYQMYHGLALVAVGLAALHGPSRRWDVASCLFVVGVLLFSGSLYAIALSGAVHLRDLPYGVALIVATPAGGMCLLAGWVAVLWAIAAPPRTIATSGSAPHV